MEKVPRRISNLGRVFLLFCFALVFYRFGWVAWSWMLFTLGVIFYASGLKKDGNLELLYPGTILILFTGMILLRQHHLMDFPLWRIWPLLFGSMGVGFLIMWLVGNGDKWVFIPAGFLLFISGGALANNSFTRYQIWLRGLFNLWYVILILTVILLVIYLWYSRSERD